MADEEIAKPWTPPRLEDDKKERVAVVGSGPAGLTAALRLAQLGYKVTVHEALPVAGGMMRVGIPEYRLPPDILQAEIDNIKRAGVEIKTCSALGRDFSLEDLQRLNDAVVLAIGAHRSRRLGVPSDLLPGVLPGTTFLRDVALGKRPDLTGKRVAVVGGGDVAIDAARTAWRCGASIVHVLYRRTRDEMPAIAAEVAAAEAEGIQLHFLVTPTRVIGEAKVTGVECQQQRLGDFDTGGRRRPIPIPDATFELPVDLIIPAIGQAPETDGPAFAGLEVNRDGTLQVDARYRTSALGVFAAGDAAEGPATVAQAVAQGNAVAFAVHRQLQGRLNGRVARYEVLHAFGQARSVPLGFDRDEYADAARAAVAELEVADRRSFREVELGFEPAVARAEARRCLRCDLD
jgi:NADH-quinone oxidoreductase subunit F